VLGRACRACVPVRVCMHACMHADLTPAAPHRHNRSPTPLAFFFMLLRSRFSSSLSSTAGREMGGPMREGVEAPPAHASSRCFLRCVAGPRVCCCVLLGARMHAQAPRRKRARSSPDTSCSFSCTPCTASSSCGVVGGAGGLVMMRGRARCSQVQGTQEAVRALGR